MKAAGLSLFAWSMLICAHSASAKAPVPATPIGSPGDWLNPSDYPATALRFDMTGITAFGLALDTTGKPTRCSIVESSGFDVLDTATCQRLMSNARFSPSRDRAGKPVEGTYSGRVRWVMPPGATPPLSENFASMLMLIDQTGKVTSCRMVFHVLAVPPESAKQECEQTFQLLSPARGLELRGSFQGPLAELEFQQSDVFTPALRARVLAPMPGYEQRGLNIHHFTVTRDGKLGQCNYEQQRGDALLATDFCVFAQRSRYDPPFAAFNKDGTASGWHIARVLLKTSP